MKLDVDVKSRSKSVSSKRKSVSDMPHLESDMIGDGVFDNKPEENKVLETNE